MKANNANYAGVILPASSMCRRMPIIRCQSLTLARLPGVDGDGNPGMRLTGMAKNMLEAYVFFSRLGWRR